MVVLLKGKSLGKSISLSKNEIVNVTHVVMESRIVISGRRLVFKR